MTVEFCVCCLLVIRSGDIRVVTGIRDERKREERRREREKERQRRTEREEERKRQEMICQRTLTNESCPHTNESCLAYELIRMSHVSYEFIMPSYE